MSDVVKVSCENAKRQGLRPISRNQVIEADHPVATLKILL